MYRTPSYGIKGPTILIPSALVLDLQLCPLHTWLSLLVWEVCQHTSMDQLEYMHFIIQHTATYYYALHV